MGGLRPGDGDVQLTLGSDGATLRGRALAENGEGVGQGYGVFDSEKWRCGDGCTHGSKRRF